MQDVIKNNWLGVVLLILVAVWLGIYGVQKNAATQFAPHNNSIDTSSGDAKALAQCLTDRGFKLYGTGWCGYCKKQKEMFGEAVGLVNYIECAVPNSDEQTEACNKAGIKSYPTWKFPDGTKQTGVMTLAELAKVSGCPVI